MSMREQILKKRKRLSGYVTSFRIFLGVVTFGIAQQNFAGEIQSFQLESTQLDISNEGEKLPMQILLMLKFTV